MLEGFLNTIFGKCYAQPLSQKIEEILVLYAEEKYGGSGLKN